MAGGIIYGKDVEAAGAFADVAFGQKMAGSAGQEMLLAGSDTKFGERGEVFAEGASADLDESQGIAIITNHV
jgi:hypothetical protein